jgi:hypothetical protein
MDFKINAQGSGITVLSMLNDFFLIHGGIL